MNVESKPPTIPRESGLDVNKKGHLTIEGWDTIDLTSKFGTPLWVVSETTLRNNFRTLKSAFEKQYPNVTVAYASKANHAPAILRVMFAEGAHIDCVSLTQIRLANQAGYPADKIIFNGNNKSELELETAVQMGIGAINIDSVDELDLLNQICARLGTSARVNLRLRGSYTRLVESDHEFVEKSTAGDKFGLDIPCGQAIDAFRKALGMEWINVLGLSHHVGWSAYKIRYDKNLDLIRLKIQVEEILDFALQLHDELGFTPAVLDFGGGFRKPRPHGFGPNRIRSIPTIDEYAETIFSVINKYGISKTLGQPKLVFEPGGYIVSDAVTLLSKVGNIKSVNSGPGVGKWVAVDSSAYFFVRKLMFGFYHHTIIANKALEPPTEIVDIVGSTCAYDYIADKAKVPTLERGDIIATLDQGSYCEMISSQYCGVPRPSTILVNKERAGVIKRRETSDDIISQYRIPDWLQSPEQTGSS